MATYYQFGLHPLASRIPAKERDDFSLVQVLVTAVFLVSVCLIAIVVGVASAQYP
jgi:hypothetical protein